MKKTLLLAFLAPTILFAQEDSTDNTQKKFIKVISIAAYGGGNIFTDGYEDRTIFQKVAPGNPIMFADLTGYSNQQYYYDYGSFNTNFTKGMLVSTRLRGMKKFAELRFGINHSRMMISNQYYTKESTTQIATSSLPGGEILYTDSTHISSYYYKWYTDVLSLDISWIVKSDPGKILNCYTGFGVTGGLGYNGVISAEHREYSYHTNRSNGPSHVYYTNNQQQHTLSYNSSAAPMIAQLGGYIPIGFNMRLGRRHSFFSHLTLFGEYQGALYMISVPGVTSKLRTSSNMYGGMRYYIRAPKYVKKHDRERNRPRRGYSHGEEHLRH